MFTAQAAGKYVKLKDFPISADAQNVQISLAEFDMTKFRKLHIVGALKCSDADMNGYATIYLNDISAAKYIQSTSGTTTLATSLGMMYLGNDPEYANFEMDISYDPSITTESQYIIVRISNGYHNTIMENKYYVAANTAALYATIASGITAITFNTAAAGASSKIKAGGKITVYGVKA